MEQYHCHHAGVYGGQFTVAEIQAGIKNCTMPPDVQVFNHHYNQWMPAAYFLQAWHQAQGGNSTWAARTQQPPPQQPAAGVMPTEEMARKLPVNQGMALSEEHEQIIEEPEGNDWVGLGKVKWAVVTILSVLIMVWGKSSAVDRASDQMEKKRQEKEAAQQRTQKQLDGFSKKLLDDFKKSQAENDPMNVLMR